MTHEYYKPFQQRNPTSAISSHTRIAPEDQKAAQERVAAKRAARKVEADPHTESVMEDLPQSLHSDPDVMVRTITDDSYGGASDMYSEHGRQMTWQEFVGGHPDMDDTTLSDILDHVTMGKDYTGTVEGGSIIVKPVNENASSGATGAGAIAGSGQTMGKKTTTKGSIFVGGRPIAENRLRKLWDRKDPDGIDPNNPYLSEKKKFDIEAAGKKWGKAMKTGDRKTAQKQADKVKNNLEEGVLKTIGDWVGTKLANFVYDMRQVKSPDGTGWRIFPKGGKFRPDTLGMLKNAARGYDCTMKIEQDGSVLLTKNPGYTGEKHNGGPMYEGIGDKVKQAVGNAKLVHGAYKAAKSGDIDSMPNMDMSKIDPKTTRAVPGIPNALDDLIGKGLWKLLGIAAKKEGNQYVFRGINGPIDQKIIDRAQGAVQALGMSLDVSEDGSEMRVSEGAPMGEGVMDWARNKAQNAINKNPTRRSVPGLNGGTDDFIGKIIFSMMGIKASRGQDGSYILQTKSGKPMSDGVLKQAQYAAPQLKMSFVVSPDRSKIVFKDRESVGENTVGPHAGREKNAMRSPTTPNKTMQQFVGEEGEGDEDDMMSEGRFVSWTKNHVFYEGRISAIYGNEIVVSLGQGGLDGILGLSKVRVDRATLEEARVQNYHSVFFKGDDGKYSHHFDADNLEDANSEMRGMRNQGEKPLRLVVPKSEANWHKRDVHDYVTKALERKKRKGMNEDDDLAIPSFLKRDGPKKTDAELKNLLNPSSDRAIHNPTDIDRKVGQLIADELGKKGIKVAVEYIPSYMTRATVKVTIDSTDSGDASTHGPSRWIGNIIHPIGYGIKNVRKLHNGTEYLVRVDSDRGDQAMREANGWAAPNPPLTEAPGGEPVWGIPQYKQLGLVGEDLSFGEVSLFDFRDLAYDYHGGQNSALYSFASTDLDIHGIPHAESLLTELEECLELAHTNGEETNDTPDFLIIQAMIKFVQAVIAKMQEHESPSPEEQRHNQENRPVRNVGSIMKGP